MPPGERAGFATLKRLRAYARVLVVAQAGKMSPFEPPRECSQDAARWIGSRWACRISSCGFMYATEGNKRRSENLRI
jgi:hypothetical protein